LQQWLLSTLSTISAKSELAGAIRYALTRWKALSHYIDDGRIEIDNNGAERALRDVALGRKNYLFAGRTPEANGRRRSTACWARLNGIDPDGYLRTVLAQHRRASDQPDRGAAAMASRAESAASLRKAA